MKNLKKVAMYLCSKIDNVRTKAIVDHVALLHKCNNNVFEYKIQKDLCVASNIFDKFDIVELYAENRMICDWILDNDISILIFVLGFGFISGIFNYCFSSLLNVEHLISTSIIIGNLYGGIYALICIMLLINVRFAIYYC